MANIGVAPLEPDSEVGKVRLTIGDVSYVALVPPVTGFGDYQMFSDDEITQFLSNGSDSVLAASGWAYLSLAGAAALESKSLADYDLKIDFTKRAADLRLMAQYYFDLAASIDGTSDYFDIVPTGTDGYCWPELSERPYWVY